MSDGVIRICREHDMELRQYGTHFACPRGHSCDVDWYVKQPVARPAPSLAAPVIDLNAPRETAAAIRSKSKEKPMPKTKSQIRRGELQPHGTHQRYFQEVKAGTGACDACKKAAAAYSKARRDARNAAAGKPAHTSTRATKTAPVRKSKPVHKKPAKVQRSKALVVGRSPAEWLGSPAVADLESKVIRLRADLAEAEQAYLAHVQKLLPGLVLSR